MFRFYVKAIANTNHLPDYTMEYLDQDKIIFKNRDFKERNAAQPALGKMFAVSSATVEKARMMVLEAGTGWDFHALYNEYAQALQVGHEPKNINGAFIGFIKRKVKKRP
jgi:hypothetical protein